jgi:hypothetical protein
MNANEQLVEIRTRIAVASGLALLGAGLVLVMFILPAEFGVDPLGTGARLGLLPLGVIGQQVDQLNRDAETTVSGAAAIIAAEPRPFHHETVDFTIAPGEFMEYKYRLEKGKALLYSWSASQPVTYEFHAEPDGAPRGYAQSYEKKPDTSAASGTLTAPFSGIHGWYWENTGNSPVTVTLTASGFFPLSHEFRKDAPVKNKTFQ